MFKKILVPLDGSSLAERSMPVAIHLAQKMQAELVLLSVAWREEYTLFEPTGYGLYWPEESRADLREELDRYLDHISQKYAASQVPLRCLLREGDEAGTIVDTAVAEKVDLIVISTHGRSGMSRWLMGSVTERVLRQAPCPILIVRDSTLPRNLIITLDGSKLAESALLPGLALSLALPAEITLVHVQEGREPPSAEHPQDAYLKSVVERFPHHPMQMAAPAGNPAESILDSAADLSDCLIVICSHGRTGLARWVFGSVTEKVVRGAAGPVLVIWPPSGQLQ